MIVGRFRRIPLKPAHDHETHTRPDRYPAQAISPCLNSYPERDITGRNRRALPPRPPVSTWQHRSHAPNRTTTIKSPTRPWQHQLTTHFCGAHQLPGISRYGWRGAGARYPANRICPPRRARPRQRSLHGNRTHVTSSTLRGADGRPASRAPAGVVRGVWHLVLAAADAPGRPPGTAAATPANALVLVVQAAGGDRAYDCVHGLYARGPGHASPAEPAVRLGGR
jgi:hypothetical protein